jgi:uncharacterized membrane protein YhiD involved in acid resistance
MLDNLDSIKDIISGTTAPFSITQLVFNLIIGAVISLFLKFHYIKYGSTLSNRNEFSNVFPFILLTTTLVIAIVKSSLALSLGLVGALSIVRFRTPIKEPEELAYLFLSIAGGLGLGANQTLPTIISILMILTIMTILKKKNVKNKTKNMFITIERVFANDNEKNKIFDDVNSIVSNNVEAFDLRRLDYSKDSIHITLIVNFKNLNSLKQLILDLDKKYSGININYIDQNQIPSI